MVNWLKWVFQVTTNSPCSLTFAMKNMTIFAHFLPGVHERHMLWASSSAAKLRPGHGRSMRSMRPGSIVSGGSGSAASSCSVRGKSADITVRSLLMPPFSAILKPWRDWPRMFRSFLLPNRDIGCWIVGILDLLGILPDVAGLGVRLAVDMFNLLNTKHIADIFKLASLMFCLILIFVWFGVLQSWLAMKMCCLTVHHKLNHAFWEYVTCKLKRDPLWFLAAFRLELTWVYIIMNSSWKCYTFIVEAMVADSTWDSHSLSLKIIW